MGKTTRCILLMLLAAGAAAWAAKPATVRLTQEGLTLELVLDTGSKLSITSKGMPLRPGTYNVKAVRLLKLDEKARTWEMRFEGDLGTSTLNNLTVDEGQEKVVEDVEPLVFHVVTWQRPTEAGKPKSVLIRVSAAGRHSEMYYPGAFLKGERPPMPQYRILDAQGKLLASGRVSGKGPIYDFTWLPPPAFAGKFRVEIEPVMGPFTWKVLGIEGEVK